MKRRPEMPWPSEETIVWIVFAAFVAACMVLFLAIQTCCALDRVTCQATWYGKAYNGRITTCGEIYDRWGYTIACNWLPCQTVVRLTYQDQVVIARVTDHYDQAAPENQGWRIDVSEGIATEMGWEDAGWADVELEVIP